MSLSVSARLFSSSSMPLQIKGCSGSPGMAGGGVDIRSSHRKHRMLSSAANKHLWNKFRSSPRLVMIEQLASFPTPDDSNKGRVPGQQEPGNMFVKNSLMNMDRKSLDNTSWNNFPDTTSNLKLSSAQGINLGQSLCSAGVTLGGASLGHTKVGTQ